ncbi:MAG: hypothetical protein D6816_12440 [Bacteroidetes bacterium]|nr:MAG: hypothetical protein D6816_12440 [Bacteroidota bacterium]
MPTERQHASIVNDLDHAQAFRNEYTNSQQVFYMRVRRLGSRLHSAPALYPPFFVFAKNRLRQRLEEF